ncbi:hypothetical protein ACFX4I_09245 [Peribacillus sp. YIM B13472]
MSGTVKRKYSTIIPLQPPRRKTMEELPELIDHINLLIAEGKGPR